MIRKKIIAIVLSASLTTGFIQNPVRVEASSLDEIYANAYRATVAAMEGKTQKLINEARVAIKTLPKNLNWAIGEFSKQVDKVQQPIFEKAYKAVVLAEKNPTQANIDAGKAAIDPDMPIYYKGSYSSKLDQIQQKKMKEALDAYNKALNSNLQEDMDLANKLFDDIRTAKSLAISEWPDLVQAKGNIKDLDNGKTNVNNYSILSDSGKFGPKNEKNPTTIKGNILVSNTGGKSLTLKNMNIEGNLIINFGSGDVVLENVNVNGVIVNNIGANSLHVKGNSEIKDISIKDTNNDARIVIEDNSSIQNTNVLSGAKLEVAKNSTNSKAFGNVLIAPTDTNKIILQGKFDNVFVDKSADVELAKDSKVSTLILKSDAAIKGSGDIVKVNVETSVAIDMQAQSIQVLEVGKKADGSKINIAGKTKVNTLNVNSSVNITGKGTIENANIGANGTTIEIKPDNVSVTEGVKVEVAGEVKDESNSNVIEKVPEGTEDTEKPEDSEENTPPVIVPPSIEEDEDYNPPVNTEPAIDTFIEEISEYLGTNIESSEEYEKNDKGTLAVLKKYNYYFPELKKLDYANETMQKLFASFFRSTLRQMKDNNIKFTYSNLEEKIHMLYQSMENQIEASKFIGHYYAETKVIDFKLPQGQSEDIDVTDEIIKLEIPLSEGTTYEILRIYDYIDGEEVDNEYFYVKEGANGENRIFLKPNIKFGTIDTKIDISIKTKAGNFSTTFLHLKATLFPQDSDLETFIEEVSKYLDENIGSSENNKGVLDVLNKYKEYFPILDKLEDLSDESKLEYASMVRRSLTQLKNDNIEFTYSKIEQIINTNYSFINISIENSKFKGHFKAETPIIKFTVPEGEEDLDVTDELIGFDRPLAKGTTYEIIGIYDYINDEQIENKYFYVKEGANGEKRIFVKRNNNVGTINTNINVSVRIRNGITTASSSINLSLQATFPEAVEFKSFISEIDEYLGESREDNYTYEANNNGTLKVLNKYKDYFLGLSKLNQLLDKHQLKYALTFRSILRDMKNNNVQFTYSKVEGIIDSAYEITKAFIESSKFKGHFEAETPIITFTAQKAEEDLDVTDELIDFDSPLDEGTTYEILGVYDYNKDGKIENKNFYVKEDANGQKRIFVKPNNNVETIQTNIEVIVKTKSGSTSTISLTLKANFGENQ